MPRYGQKTYNIFGLKFGCSKPFFFVFLPSYRIDSVAHWKATHKRECKTLAETKSTAIVLDTPLTDLTHVQTMNWQSGSSYGKGFRKPSNVAIGQMFYLKVQGNGPQSPLMIYDETRACNFYYEPRQSGFQEIYNSVSAEPTWQGRKTYIKASFDADGKCTVYPGLTSIKKW